MKNTILLFALLFPFIVSAIEPQPVASTVRDVTLFKSGAQVTRTASHGVAAGRSELVFKGLSINIQEKTIQLKADGAVTIMSVRFQINHLEEMSKQQEIKRLEAENETLADRIARLRNDFNVFKQEESLLSKNQVQVVGVQNNPLKTQDLHELADFQRARLAEVLTKQYELGQQIKQLEKQADAVKNQLAALNAQATNPSGEITVAVNAERAAQIAFTFSYYVTPASWEPVYDIRVKDVSNPVTLFQKANLYQQTGEDWRDVKLSLSTGDPTESGTRPTLNTWRLRYTSPYTRTPTQNIGSRYFVTGTGNPGELKGSVLGDDDEPLIGATVSAYGPSGSSIGGVVTDVNGEFVLKCPLGVSRIVVSYTGFNTLEASGIVSGQVIKVIMTSGAQLNETVVTALGLSNGKKKSGKDEEDDDEPPVSVIQLPTTLLYEIDLPVTALSDGQLQLVDIKSYELPAQYRYHCAPKLDLSAYLTAQVTGWEPLGLLSGEANLFFEGTYLGKTYLEFANVSDTLDISLGKDQNITVTRTKLKEFSKRQFLSNKKEDSRAFEIAVKNKKTQPILFTLEDQFPLSTNKDITVERSETSSATVDDATGKLTWNLNLAPAEDKKVKFGYSVKYPKEKLMVLE